MPNLVAPFVSWSSMRILYLFLCCLIILFVSAFGIGYHLCFSLPLCWDRQTRRRKGVLTYAFDPLRLEADGRTDPDKAASFIRPSSCEHPGCGLITVCVHRTVVLFWREDLNRGELLRSKFAWLSLVCLRRFEKADKENNTCHKTFLTKDPNRWPHKFYLGSTLLFTRECLYSCQ